jgi:hypothetical protein
MEFWSVFGLIMIGWTATLISTGAVPFLYIIGSESAKALCRGVGAVRTRLSLSSETQSFRLAMLAAAVQPDEWKINGLNKLTHPEVGSALLSDNGQYYIGFQAIPKWQFDKVYRTILDGQAMIKYQALNEASGRKAQKAVDRMNGHG